MDTNQYYTALRDQRIVQNMPVHPLKIEEHRDSRRLRFVKQVHAGSSKISVNISCGLPDRRRCGRLSEEGGKIVFDTGALVLLQHVREKRSGVSDPGADGPRNDPRNAVRGKIRGGPPGVHAARINRRSFSNESLA